MGKEQPELKSFESFFREIEALQASEKEKEPKGGGTAHFLYSDFNPRELTQEDVDIWEKVKSGEITWDDWRSYAESFIDQKTMTLREGIPRSRDTFRAFIGNKANPVLFKKERWNFPIL